MGMSFNRTLWKLTGRQIGREARALMNAGNGYSTFWAPVVNLAREPRWGRNIETPGEDPFLTGQYAKYPVVIINWLSDSTSPCAAACVGHCRSLPTGAAGERAEPSRTITGTMQRLAT